MPPRECPPCHLALHKLLIVSVLVHHVDSPKTRKATNDGLRVPSIDRMFRGGELLPKGDGLLTCQQVAVEDEARKGLVKSDKVLNCSLRNMSPPRMMTRGSYVALLVQCLMEIGQKLLSGEVGVLHQRF